MRFEWDPAEDNSNRKKHSLSFEEAATRSETGVHHLEIHGEKHSDQEDRYRFIAIGPIERGGIVVTQTVRDDDALRSFSAHLATKKGRRRFEKFGGKAMSDEIRERP